MSRERELLEWALAVIDGVYDKDALLIQAKIRAFLSTPEPTHDEPVAWFSPTSKTFSTVETSHHTAPLFLHPAPRPEFVRLSEEEIMDFWFEASKTQPLESLIVFARAIEDALERANSSTILSLNDTISANSRDLGHE